MKKSDTMIAGAIAGVLALAVLIPATAAEQKMEMEKCYGVAKAGKNDCQTATSACAGTSKKDGAKDAWLSVPKGSCEKIVGGSLKAAKG
jgi:uncharacterized membrane protein